MLQFTQLTILSRQFCHCFPCLCLLTTFTPSDPIQGTCVVPPSPDTVSNILTFQTYYTENFGQENPHRDLFICCLINDDGGSLMISPIMARCEPVPKKGSCVQIHKNVHNLAFIIWRNTCGRQYLCHLHEHGLHQPMSITHCAHLQSTTRILFFIVLQ